MSMPIARPTVGCLTLVGILLGPALVCADLAVLDSVCTEIRAAARIPLVRSGAAKEPLGDGERGFVIRTVKATFTEDWDYDQMNKLLDFGCTGPLCMAPGMAIPGTEQGTRVSEFVNLHDSGRRGVFSADNGCADESYPGIDPFESATGAPASSDDDDNFATEILALIHLNAGLHLVGANSQDGAIIEIGGVEIGRTPQWQDASNADFIFAVEQDGYYTFRVRSLAGEGGASLELHELVRNSEGVWRRILLGDVDAGGSLVVVPEPATGVLLVLGALPLVRHRK
jgi:hypothetical protein